MNISEFLTKLDSNLTLSLKSLDIVNNHNTATPEKLLNLSELIKKNYNNLHAYIDALKKLEIEYISNVVIPEPKSVAPTLPFLFSFAINNSLYNKNFKDSFKKDNQININTHKLKLLANAKIIDATPPLMNKNIKMLDAKDIGPNSLNLPIIKSLKEIPPSFYWYEGDRYNKQGIYCSLSKGFTCRVPFPNVISTLDQNFKINSIPCKFETKETCLAQKKKISEIYHSDVRECNYVHRGEKFTKIGSYYRCGRESFGNHESLADDLGYINTSDIKRILMHSLSDSLLSVLWYQSQFKDGNLTLANLEIY